MSTDTAAERAAVNAALDIADEVAKGILPPAELADAAVAEARAWFGTVGGPDDELWELHIDVARQVIAMGGLPADELQEWLATQRSAEGLAAEAQVSWIERALAMDDDEETD